MKSLSRLLVFAVIFTVSTFASGKSTAIINVTDITDRHLSGFNGINVAGSFDVYILQGSTESVKVDAPSNMTGHIITEVESGVLKIYNKHDDFHWGDLWGNHKKIKVYVEVKNLDNINLSGSGDAFFKDGITANTMKLSISGSGDMTGRIEVKTLESSITGSGDMRLNGHAESSTVSVVGSGDFTANNLLTINTAVRVTGSGDAKINARDRVDAAVSGSGDIQYSGAAKTINSKKTGSGDISRD